MYIQSVIQDVILLIDTTNYNFSSTLVDAEWWTFIFCSLSFALVYALDGAVMICFHTNLVCIGKQDHKKSSVFVLGNGSTAANGEVYSQWYVLIIPINYFSKKFGEYVEQNTKNLTTIEFYERQSDQVVVSHEKIVLRAVLKDSFPMYSNFVICSLYVSCNPCEISQLEGIKEITGCKKIRRKARKLIRQSLFSRIRHDSQRHLQNLKI
ncbi:hypothetical protein L3Y34_009392 [Caenorhabditis briggsae]|uniref:7TM GPCR serpentine receptor class x (Srx) domain-containing protein n=1 Tax=Caenorhabditis briggsae TaxID=6238 RepID=A0AAE9A437_CAEBR|nr:hypothetical protein L3Y34_009392 [Caenorhabditis briggsae]